MLVKAIGTNQIFYILESIHRCNRIVQEPYMFGMIPNDMRGVLIGSFWVQLRNSKC